MADFVQTMKDWRRMCNKYFDGKNWVCSKTCPMYVFEVCSKPTAKYPTPLEIGHDLAHEIECVIMSWAAEHTEPVYPTWGEWLISVGAARKIPTDIPFELRDGRIIDSPWETVVDINAPIPAVIAEKLGIEPKESV